MYLFLTECHKNNRDEEVQHHKGHEHNAGTNKESPEHWIVVQNLADQKHCIYKRDHLSLSTIATALY